jgi:hypothetical protein
MIKFGRGRRGALALSVQKRPTGTSHTHSEGPHTAGSSHPPGLGSLHEGIPRDPSCLHTWFSSRTGTSPTLCESENRRVGTIVICRSPSVSWTRASLRNAYRLRGAEVSSHSSSWRMSNSPRSRTDRRMSWYCSSWPQGRRHFHSWTPKLILLNYWQDSRGFN